MVGVSIIGGGMFRSKARCLSSSRALSFMLESISSSVSDEESSDFLTLAIITSIALLSKFFSWLAGASSWVDEVSVILRVELWSSSLVERQALAWASGSPPEDIRESGMIGFLGNMVGES